MALHEYMISITMSPPLQVELVSVEVVHFFLNMQFTSMSFRNEITDTHGDTDTSSAVKVP